MKADRRCLCQGKDHRQGRAPDSEVGLCDGSAVEEETVIGHPSPAANADVLRESVLKDP